MQLLIFVSIQPIKFKSFTRFIELSIVGLSVCKKIIYRSRFPSQWRLNGREFQNFINESH